MQRYKNAIALTGGIATGKSTVCAMLSKAGFEIVDADKMAHEMLDLHAGKIAEMFGSQYVCDGRVDRKALGEIIFTNKENRIKLEHFLHPLIQMEILSQAAVLEEKGVPYILDIPLYFETKHYEVNEVALVYAPREVQKQRLIVRNNLTETEAENRLRTQIAIDDKKDLSSFVIDNTKDVKHLESEVERFITYIRSNHANHKI